MPKASRLYCLRFTLGQAPKISKKSQKVSILMLPQMNIWLIIYLNDLLTIGRNLEEILTSRDLKTTTDGSGNRVRISRYKNKLCKKNDVHTIEKYFEHHSTLSEDTESKTCNALRIDKFDREVDFDLSGIPPGSSPSPIFSNASNNASKIKLFRGHNSGGGLTQRTNLLVPKPNIEQIETHKILEPKYRSGEHIAKN